MAFIIDTNVFLTAAEIDLQPEKVNGRNWKPEKTDVQNSKNWILYALANGGIRLTQPQCAEMLKKKEEAIKKGYRLVGTPHQLFLTATNAFLKAPPFCVSEKNESENRKKQKSDYLAMWKVAPEKTKTKKSNLKNRQDLLDHDRSLETNDGFIVDWVLAETAARNKDLILSNDADLQWITTTTSINGYSAEAEFTWITHPNFPGRKQEKPKEDEKTAIRQTKIENDLWIH